MSKMYFTDQTGKRRFTLTSNNTRDIVLKLKSDGAILTEAAIREEIKLWTNLPRELNLLEVITPSDGETNFSGTITLRLDKNQVTLNGKYYVQFEVNRSLDFRKPDFSITKTGSTIPTLSFSEITGIDFRSNEPIYVRAKLFNVDLNNKIGYSTEFSSPIKFYPIQSSYSATNVSVEVNQDDGSLLYSFDKYGVSVGKPPVPNKVEVTIRDVASGSSETYTYDVDGSKAFTVKTPSNFVGRFILPSKTYDFTFVLKYIGDDGVVSSPNLTVTTIRQGTSTTSGSRASIGLVDFTVDSYGMITNGLSMAKQPTFFIKNIKSKYNFLAAPSTNMFIIGNDNTLQDTIRAGGLKYTIKVYEGDVTGNLQGATPVATLTKTERLYDLANSSDRDFLVTCNQTLRLSTLHTVSVNIRYMSNATNDTLSPLAYEFTASKTFTTPTTYVANDVDNLTTARTYNNVSYYGELRENLLGQSVWYRGKYVPNKQYISGDEVDFNGVFYRCVNGIGTENVTDPSLSPLFANVTLDSNILPKGDWLLKKLGIPCANPIHLDINGDIVREPNVDDSNNSTEGWIKAQNKENQMVYISKKPFVTSMSLLELKRRGLLGSSSRTIRLGTKVFKVRLLENTHTPLITEEFETTKTQNELDLYQYLFTNLHTYQVEELGLKDSGTILLSNGKMDYTKQSIGINISTSKVDYETDTKGSLIIVLEEILKGYEPYYKAIPQAPIGELTYDAGSDTGYYGTASIQDVITPYELKMLYGLDSLVIEDTNLFYYKFYWHGQLVYIPSKPLGKIKVKDIKNARLFYGHDNTKSFRAGNVNIKATLLNATASYFMFDADKTNQLEIDSLLTDLIFRVTTEYDNGLNNIYTDARDKFINQDYLSLSKYSILLKDVINDGVDGKDYLILKNKVLEAVDEEALVDYYPVLVTDCIDYSNDLTYPTGQYRQYVVTKEQRTITETYLDKEMVTKKREVTKTRDVLMEREEVTIVKTPTGEFTINEVEKTSNYDYCMIMYFAPKTASAYLKVPLYSKQALNIKKSNKNNTVFYSENMRSYTDYLAKSVMVENDKKLTPTPFHTNIFFPSLDDGMNYISNLTTETNMMKISNSNPEKPNNVNGMPGSLVCGNVSSSEMAFIYNSNFSLSNPELDVGTAVNDQVSIDFSRGKAINSWAQILDSSSNIVPIPFLSPYIGYETLTPDGKNIVDNFYGYIKSNNITTTPVEDLCFGFVIVDSSNLKYLKDGMVTGTIYTPDIVSLADDYIIPEYFGRTDDSRSDGTDYLDVLNKVEVFITEEIVQKVPYYETVTYVDIETYQEEVYVEKTREKVVYVDVIKYI